MPWADVPLFMRELVAFDTPSARALQWTILTGARTGETLGARWSEIQGDLWVIPDARMKEGEEHQVPLTPEMLALLGKRGGNDDLIFGDLREDALRTLIKDRDCTVHGFRSTFTDWAAEQGYTSELREMAIAHAVGDETERSYRRTTLLPKRREMMQAWSAFACGRPVLKLVAS